MRYYKEFPAVFRSVGVKPYGLAGAGGVKIIRAYYLSQVVLRVGNKDAPLQNVPVIPIPTKTSMDKTYGNLGRDLMAPFPSFTLDFVNMRFLLGPSSGGKN